MEMAETVYHIPAMLEPCMEGLNINPDGVYADLTFGGGGHSRAILSRLSKKGKLIVFDQDMDAYANVPDDDRIIFCHSNFCYFANFLDYYRFPKIDGIIADLGVSFHHFDEAERGFSFRFDGPLDMRMNRDRRKSAETVLNEYAEDELTNIFRLYGEMNNAKKIAQTIVKARASKPLTQISQLNAILEPMVGADRQKKDLAKVFQAIRIEVNDEMDTLKRMLESVPGALKEGGRLVVLTYHSLEDRLVKNFVKVGNFDGKQEKDFYGNAVRPLEPIGKVTGPDDEEIERNPRSRSAKLRVAERTAND